MRGTTFHILGLAHQCVTDKVPSCAYTAKVVNMCLMLRKAGHAVILYHAGSVFDANLADDYVEVVNDSTMEALYGDRFYETFNQVWKSEDAAWSEFRRRAAMEIGRRLTCQDDIVLASYGTCHERCCPSPASAMVVEMGVGYEGVFALRKVWESYAWQHYVYGARGNRLNPQHDTVIPNFINSDDFRFKEEKDGTALFLGRVNLDKGILKAYEACQMAGYQLTIAGTGDKEWITANMPKANYVGMVGRQRRRQLLSNASVLLALTQYTEPFGGVAIEAAYSGTPVIASDWGAFTETILPGQTGYRVRDVYEAATALKQLKDDPSKIHPRECHEWGKRFTLENIWPRYDAYFEHQLDLHHKENGG